MFCYVKHKIDCDSNIKNGTQLNLVIIILRNCYLLSFSGIGGVTDKRWAPHVPTSATDKVHVLLSENPRLTVASCSYNFMTLSFIFIRWYRRSNIRKLQSQCVPIRIQEIYRLSNGEHEMKVLWKFHSSPFGSIRVVTDLNCPLLFVTEGKHEVWAEGRKEERTDGRTPHHSSLIILTLLVGV